MGAYLQDHLRRASTAAFASVAFAGTLAAFAISALSGTKTGTVLGLGLTLGPVVLYAMIVAPVIFPFSLYVFLTPLDSALTFSSFGTFTRLLGLASGAALLFYMLRTKRLGDLDRSVATWGLLILWMAASMFWATDANLSMASYPTALQLFGLYAVVSMIRIDFSRLRAVMVSAIAGGAVSAAYTLYLYHNGMANFKDRLWLRTDTVNVSPDHFAAALLLPVILALVAVLWARSPLGRLAAIVALGFMLAAMVLAGSRGAELALLVMLIYLFVRDPKHRLALAGIGGVLLAGVLAVAGPAFALRWSTALSNGGAGRTDIWKVGWLAFKQNWLFGAGYNNFMLAYDQAFIQVFQPLYANWNRVSHNILLGTAVDLGIVGLALLLLAWFTQFNVLRTIARHDDRFPLRVALEAAVLGLFVAGMFADLMLEKYTWLAFMLVILTRNAVLNPARERRRLPVPLQEMPANA